MIKIIAARKGQKKKFGDKNFTFVTVLTISEIDCVGCDIAVARLMGQVRV